MAAAKRILVVQTAFLGDLLLTVPLFKYLKSTFPQSEITLVARKGFGSLFKELLLVDRVFEIQKKNKESYRKIIAALQGTSFDLLLSPHESVTTALFVRRIKAQKKIGFHKWWNGYFFDERIQKDFSLPDALRQMSLLQNCDPQLKRNLLEFHRADLEWQKQNQKLLTPVPQWASPVVPLPLDFAAVQAQYDLPANFVCLFPGSVWKTKQWTEEGFIGVGQKFAQAGHSVIVMGGPGEEELAARVAEKIPKALNLAGRTKLLESLVILSRAQVVVTNDSAGQHLASLVEAPTVSVFGPTVLEFGYRPWNTRARVIERKGLACRPCGKHGHHQCPLGTHECMKSLQTSEVFAGAESVLSSARK